MDHIYFELENKNVNIILGLQINIYYIKLYFILHSEIQRYLLNLINSLNGRNYWTM